MLRTSASSGENDQETLLVGLARGDVQQGDELAGRGVPVLDQAVVRQLGQFLDPDARIAENLHDRPGPERLVFFQPQVPAFPGFRVLSPGAAAARGQL